MDFVKDYLAPKSFSIAAYISVILHLFLGAIFSVIAGDIRSNEKENFRCSVERSKDRVYVESSCFGMYDDLINDPLPFYGFVLLSFGLHAVVNIVYSLCVKSRVEKIKNSLKKNEDVESNESARELRKRRSNSRYFSVFNMYILYLVIRFALGALCNVLQYAVLFPLKFPSKFLCDIRSEVASSNSAPVNSISCKNLTASEKTTWGMAVFVVNALFAAIGLVEMIFLLVNEFSRGITHFSNSDEDFIIIHFLRKSRSRRRGDIEEVPLLQIPSRLLDVYKEQIFCEVLPVDLVYGQNLIGRNINDIFVDLVIHRGRAKHDILKEFGRHEIDDVYYELPQNSIFLHQLEDLFKPYEDTKDEFPRTILVVGRPGIGKTVLCHKIKNDWASNESDVSSFYNRKIVFFFTFRWFNIDDSKFSLKSFLHCGIQGDISSEQFDVVFEHICQTSENAILIFDGLDESNADFKHLMSNVELNLVGDEISPAALFVKLVSGEVLPRATILVSSRATADDVYSKLEFQRQVEVLGFTRVKIEEYVERFCCNESQLGKKDMIMKCIESNVEIRDLCYIPVNCFIVCFTLLGCLAYPNSDNSPLPTTLTELYGAAVFHLQDCHGRNVDKLRCPNTLRDLQKLAFSGVENGQLIFDSKLLSNDMEESSLLHRLSNPILPGRYQYCFIHLTMQEFLAAQHIVEAKTPREIWRLVTLKMKLGNWRLVLQFVAGLLGDRNLTDEYHYCVDAFINGLRHLGRGEVNERELATLKCVKEFKNESIIKEAALKCSGEELTFSGKVFFVSDCAALTTYLKWVPNLKSLEIAYLLNDENVGEIAKMFQERCFESLSFVNLFLEESSWLKLLSGLAVSSCKLNHQHCQVKNLCVTNSNISDPGMIHICEFLKSGSGRHLKELSIGLAQITSKGVSKLCETLSGDEVGNLLEFLYLSYSPLGDEAVPFLCDMYRKKLVKQTDVRLRKCHLTSDCMASLCGLLNEEHFQCTELDLEENQLGDKAVKVLHENLIKEQTELEELNVSTCGLTSECMPLLCSLLVEKFSNVVELFVSNNEIGGKGADLFRALARKHFKLKRLYVDSCGLADDCMPALCDLFKDERCNIESMHMRGNKITDKYILRLCTALYGRRLTYRLALWMPDNHISEQGESFLHNIGTHVRVEL